MKGCRPLTDPEVALLSRSFGGTYALRDRAWFILGLTTGFRIAELLSLRLGDVWQYGRVVDQLTVRRAHMKQKREGRTVPVHPDAQAALTAWVRWLRQQPGVTAQTYVFRSRKGGNRPISPVQAWRILRETCAANELMGKLGGPTACGRRSPRRCTASSASTSSAPNGRLAISRSATPNGHCQLIAGQHAHQPRRGMTASGLDAYAVVGRVVSSCQVPNLGRIA
jgi:Phage integrase family